MEKEVFASYKLKPLWWQGAWHPQLLWGLFAKTQVYTSTPKIKSQEGSRLPPNETSILRKGFACLSVKRDTYNYNLWNGRKKVYEGITTDPESREQQHQQDKKFTRMEVQKPAVSRDTALEREQEAIERYRRSHGGRPPKYNQ